MSAVVLMLLDLVGMVMLLGYMVCVLLVASLTLAEISKLLLPAWSSEYAFPSA